MSASGNERDLRLALEELASGSTPIADAHSTLETSWRRSLGAGLVPDTLVVPYGGEVDPEGELVRAAQPIMDAVAGDLADLGVGVLLADDHGRVIARSVRDSALTAGLDRIHLAPGFVYSEEGVGTNGVGTALEEHGGVLVRGDEHFAAALTRFCCAGVPIRDPGTGRVRGVVDLTCWAPDSSPLLLALSRRAAAEMENRLVDGSRRSAQAAFKEFLSERRRAKEPIVLVHDGRIIPNTAASRVLAPPDGVILRSLADRTLDSRVGQSVATTLSTGSAVNLRSEPVLDGREVVAAIVHLEAREQHPEPRSGRAVGWDGITRSERTILEQVALGKTNREIAEHLVLSRYTVDTHLRSVFRKLGVRSRVELTRLTLEHGDTLAVRQ